MSTEPELLRAVLANPDEDGPRLAYAAWCEQQPERALQARSTFIRLQLQVAASAATPSSGRALRAVEAEDLLAEYRSVWLGALGPLVREAVFFRGFVELVHVAADAFPSIASRLFAAGPIRHLRLVGSASWPIVFESPHLRGLHSLDFTRCGLSTADVVRLAATPTLTDLRWLSLTYNPIGEEAVIAIVESVYLQNLAYVNLLGTQFPANEQYAFDSGLVVDTWMPEPGLALERRFGRIAWLHHAAKTAADTVPSRFTIAPTLGHQTA